MDISMPMLTTMRHNRITCSLWSCIFDMLKRNEVNALQEVCALGYWGYREKIGEQTLLVNIDELKDIPKFTTRTINVLSCVYPDFFLFKDNRYISNDLTTRYAGFPDLIVEVWSDSNTEADRAFKYNLYSTSEKTEHWYIDQEGNEVECFIGARKLTSQSLKNILETQNGIKFDLRYLAITDN